MKTFKDLREDSNKFVDPYGIVVNKVKSMINTPKTTYSTGPYARNLAQKAHDASSTQLSATNSQQSVVNKPPVNNIKPIDTAQPQKTISSPVVASLKTNEYPPQNKGPQNNNGGVATPKSVQAVKPSKPEPAPAIKKAEEITKVNKPTNPVYAAKRQALDKVYDPNLDTKAQVGVTAKATTDKGVTSFYNLQRGKPSEPQNFTKVGTVANPNLQNQIQNVAKSEFPTGAIGKQFPSTAKMPNLQTFKKLGEEIEPVIEFLNKKSSWNRSNKVEIIENIKEDMISIFNILTESKYTNEVLERELNTLKTKYSLTEDQLQYLISRFLDEGFLGGVAKWVGLPALGFLAATYGKDIINNIKTSHGSEKPTEISQPVKSEPVSQKELTPVKKPDTLSSKLKAVTDVSKSATTAADQTTDLMKKASEKLDKMMKK